MWKRWLALVGRSSGPDRYLMLGVLGAPSYAFGGEVIGTAVVGCALAILLVSARLARGRGLDLHELGTGSELCFACRATFPVAETRKLARYVALLGPSTWAARQQTYCQRCARRQEVLVVALLVLLTAAGSIAIAQALKAS